jgi:hypothetical protein
MAKRSRYNPIAIDNRTAPSPPQPLFPAQQFKLQADDLNLRL